MHTNVGATPRSVWVWSLYRMAKATTTTARTRATHFQISFGAEAAATLVPSLKPKQQTGTVPQFPSSQLPSFDIPADTLTTQQLQEQLQ